MNILSEVANGLNTVSSFGSKLGSAVHDVKKIANAVGINVKIPKGVTQALNIAKTAGTVSGIFSGTYSASKDTTYVQTSNINAASGPFKWVEMQTTPDSFATPDSVLIFVGDPIYLNNSAAGALTPVGMCQGFNYSSGVNVVPIHELRCEEILVLPGKSQPGHLSINRLCGDFASLSNRVHGASGWNFSPQTATFRNLFGLLLVFYTPSRQKQISSLYFERCAINSFNLGIQAGTLQVVDSLNITCGRCINPEDKSSYTSVGVDSYDAENVENYRATAQESVGSPETPPVNTTVSTSTNTGTKPSGPVEVEYDPDLGADAEVHPSDLIEYDPDLGADAVPAENLLTQNTNTAVTNRTAAIEEEIISGRLKGIV